MNEGPIEPPIEHGGDPAALEAVYGRPADGWLDLSTGINPEGYPLGDLPEADFRGLPPAGLMADLLAAARRFYGVPDGAAVVAAPGSQALIQWLPRLLPSGRVYIEKYTYNEHSPAWRAAGHEVLHSCVQCGFRVVVNPNNPDGRIVAPADLLARVRSDGLLVVDEAFADAAPGHSVASRTGRPGLVVLRSLGKFFGLAGVRLGFALTDPALGARLATALGPWSVSTPAARLGLRALGDRAWIDATRRRLAERAAALDVLLLKAGFTVIGGTVLFRLVDSPRAPAVFERLARAGIAVRRFAGQPRRLRFGLPGQPADWARLEAALADAAAESC